MELHIIHRIEVKTLNNHQLEELSEQYLSEKMFAMATIKSYKIAFKKYIMYLKEHNIKYAKTSDIIRYRERKRVLGHSTHYIYIHISALKGFYHYLRLNQKRLDLLVEYAYDIMVSI